MFYRIATEDKNRDKIYAIVRNRGIDGFSVTQTIGYWKGERENSLTIDIATDSKLGTGQALSEELVIAAIAEDIRATNQQESVLILTLPVSIQFVSRPDFAAKRLPENDTQENQINALEDLYRLEDSREA